MNNKQLLKYLTRLEGAIEEEITWMLSLMDKQGRDSYIYNSNQEII